MIEFKTVTNKTFRNGDNTFVSMVIQVGGSLTVESQDDAIVALNNLRESLNKIEHEITKQEEWK